MKWAIITHPMNVEATLNELDGICRKKNYKETKFLSMGLILFKIIRKQNFQLYSIWI